MHILEEFRYGNINPAERPFHRQRIFDKAFRMLTKNEEKLLESLNEQEKELFDKFKACYDCEIVLADGSKIGCKARMG